MPILDLTKLQDILNSLSLGGFGSRLPDNFLILLGLLEFVFKEESFTQSIEKVNNSSGKIRGW